MEDVLLIHGHKEVAQSPSFRRQEFPIKDFERTLALYGQVDVHNISSKTDNGVLIITLAKTPGAEKKERTIEVQ